MSELWNPAFPSSSSNLSEAIYTDAIGKLLLRLANYCLMRRLTPPAEGPHSAIQRSWEWDGSGEGESIRAFLLLQGRDYGEDTCVLSHGLAARPPLFVALVIEGVSPPRIPRSSLPLRLKATCHRRVYRHKWQYILLRQRFRFMY